MSAVLVATLIAVGIAPEPEHPIKPDPRIQSLIDEAAAALNSDDLTWGVKLSAIAELRPVYLDDPVVFIRQAIFWYNQHSGGDDQELAVLVMLHHLQVTPAPIVMAMLPYIESDHEQLRQAALEQFRGIEARRGFGEPDFSHYGSLVQGHKEDPPLRLVKYMYDRSPGTAVLVMQGIYDERHDRFRDVVWAEHVIEDNLWQQRQNFLEDEATLPEAVAEVTKMARHEEWWARLYAAEIITQHPEFGTPEIVEALKNDEHELVREAMLPEERPKPRVAPPDDNGDGPARDDDTAPRDAGDQGDQ